MRFTGPISFITRIADAPRIGPAKLKAIPARAQLAASAHREQLSIPILLPRQRLSANRRIRTAPRQQRRRAEGSRSGALPIGH